MSFFARKARTRWFKSTLVRIVEFHVFPLLLHASIDCVSYCFFVSLGSACTFESLLGGGATSSVDAGLTHREEAHQVSDLELAQGNQHVLVPELIIDGPLQSQ